MLIPADVDAALDNLVEIFTPIALKLRHAGVDGDEIVERFRAEAEPPEGLPEHVADALNALAMKKLRLKFEEVAVHCFEESTTIH
jgi:hypothetical protein